MEPWMWTVLWSISGLIVFIIAFCMAIVPRYNVWAAHMEGMADLAKAQNDQQVQIAQAQSRLKSAEFNKQAEIIDAQAVAASVEIISEALKDNAGYLQWQWIRMMEKRNTKADTIYVPTEAGLPLLVSGKSKTGK